MIRLNLGCGHDLKDRRAGWVNCDFIPGPGVDLVVDLEKPLHHWGPNSVDEIYCSHVLEHIVYLERTVKEFHRILKPGGVLTIKVPYGRDPYTGHVRSLYPETLDGFIVETLDMHRGLETAPLFHRVDRHYDRSLWYRWHINRGLAKLHVPFQFKQYGRVGKKSQITWVLEKVGA